MNRTSTSSLSTPPAMSIPSSSARHGTTRPAGRPKSRTKRYLRQPPPPPLGPPYVFASDSFRDHSRKSLAARTPEHETNVVCPISESFKCPIEVELYFPPRPPLNTVGK
ncbi:hypothetical protein FS749_006884 [Ceratobasidium sp. UAMH 11750]|nr:hypothetical protein FS749_006884 [Ceratobasidium sp. UAMH 11750]